MSTTRFIVGLLFAGASGITVATAIWQGVKHELPKMTLVGRVSFGLLVGAVASWIFTQDWQSQEAESKHAEAIAAFDESERQRHGEILSLLASKDAGATPPSPLELLESGLAAYDRGSYRKARELFEKIADKNAEAQYHYGQMLRLGEGGDVESDAGVRLVEQAAETYPQAMYALAMMRIERKTGCIDNIDPVTESWLARASNAGHKDAKVVQRVLAQAPKLLRAVERAVDYGGAPNALFDDVRRLATEAADRGHPQCQGLMATILMAEAVQEPDRKRQFDGRLEALRWAYRGAQQGDFSSIMLLCMPMATVAWVEKCAARMAWMRNQGDSYDHWKDCRDDRGAQFEALFATARKRLTPIRYDELRATGWKPTYERHRRHVLFEDDPTNAVRNFKLSEVLGLRTTPGEMKSPPVSIE